MKAPGPHLNSVGAKFADSTLCCDLFLHSHLFEILLLQDFAARECVARVDLELTRGFLPLSMHRAGLIEQRLRKPAVTARFLFVTRRAADLGKQELDKLLQHPRSPPEYVESLPKKRIMFMAFYKNGVQRCIEIVPVLEAAGLDRLNCVEHLAWS
ncbi:MAG TPA: hypothetical protein VIB38_00535 [Aestuariivirgaceae bacterium]